MIDRRTKLRWRRSVRRRQKQALEIGLVTEENLDRYVFKRLIRLVAVRRFVSAWFGLILVTILALALQVQSLSSYYLANQPIAGGQFREGMVGSFTNANPLYAQTEVDRAVSRLIFSSLFSYDVKGDLVPDLAESYILDPTETIYTVKLKPGLSWHDGRPITAKDVVFTYTSIQNPLTRSYLSSSWKGVEVSEVDERTVNFKLANALSAFPQSLTTGIVPAHILSEIEPSQLRSAPFNNQRPVGSGPFSFQALEIERIDKGSMARVALRANTGFHGGVPQLDRFLVMSYPDEETLIEAFKDNEVDSLVGLDEVPAGLDTQKIVAHNIPLTSEVMVFFKNSQELLKDPLVRKGLVLGVDKQELLNVLGYPVLSVNEPLLRSQVGYNKAYAQVTGNKVEAAKVLDQAGWLANPNTKIREKAGQKLGFKLYSATSKDFKALSENLKQQWLDLGVEVEIVYQDEEELQSTVSGHSYDALLYGIAVGSDPDVYAYWHGSQGDVRSETRLNLSEYKSAVADKALEAGRTRSDKENRAIKYRPFLDAWRNDNPALALYQPRFLYITTAELNGFTFDITHSSADRYATVSDWTVRTKLQKKM